MSGSCEESFVAPREGDPGCEAASELKISSSSLAKADLRLPGGREEVVTVAVEAMMVVLDVVRMEDCPFVGRVDRFDDGRCGEDASGI